MEPVRRTVSSRDGVKLFTQVVEKGAKVWLIATHGIGEHLGRHEYLTKLFGNNVNIFQWDLRGHGRSSGEKAYIADFETYLKDLEDCIHYLQKKYGMEKFILFGHSMGALITCGFAKKYFSDELRAEAIIVNAPPVGFPGALGKIVNSVPDNFVSKLASFKPSLPLGGLVDLKLLSHKPEIAEEYVEDKFNRLKLHTKLIFEMVNFSRDIFSSPIEANIPCTCTYGTSDKVVDVGMLENYFNNIDHDFELLSIDGAYHEIHNELDKYRIPYFEILKERVHNIVFEVVEESTQQE